MLLAGAASCGSMVAPPAVSPRLLALNQAETTHRSELDRSLQLFSRHRECLDQEVAKTWTDAAFEAHGVGVGLAGPDEDALAGRGHEVFTTVEKVLSVAECEALVREAQESIDAGLAAEQAAGGGGGATHSNIGEAKVSELPRAHAWLCEALVERFYPLLASRFGGPGHAVQADRLRLHDALVIKYTAGQSQAQPMHRDSSLLSLNVVLSPRDSCAR